MNFKLSLLKNQKGFTLVELLVVIAVLGVLAAGVLVAIDPLQMLARGRDSAKKSAITELGRATIAYQTTQNDLPAGSAWATTLQGTGDIKAIPDNPDSTDCTIAGTATADDGVQGGYCYESDPTTGEFIIYARAEADSETAKITCSSPNIAYITYSSFAGKTGLACTNDLEPGVVVQ
jgi:prepilin-type N-terminal cleavage/methylation domain-containing protein